MKKISIFRKILIGTLYFILCTLYSHATSYTWNGSTSTAWGTAANWTPSVVPTSTDVVTIVTTSNHPQLSANITIAGLTLTSGTLNLNTYNLTVNGNATLSGGTLSSGGSDTLFTNGGTSTFSGTVINPVVKAIANTLVFNGSTFNGKGYFEATTTTPGTSSGNCTFNDSITIVRSNTGNGIMYLANTTGNKYNSYVKFINLGTKEINITTAGGSKFNGNVSVENSLSGGIFFGGTSGSDTLASGKTITIGAGGFTTGSLVLRNFIQLGSTIQSITLTSSATLNCIGAAFNGNVTFTAPAVLMKTTTCNGTFTAVQNGSSNISWSGHNIFNSTASITNSSTSAYLRLDIDSANTFMGNLSLVNNSSGEIKMCYSTTATSVYGNVTGNATNITFNSGSGTLAFRGSNVQSFFSPAVLFKNVLLNKSANYVTLDTSATITGTCTFTKGVMRTTASDLLTFNATSSVSGASDSSFISGPVKKIGNSAFVFPVGKGSYYRFAEISSPSGSTDAFTAEYFDTTQTEGSAKEAALQEISVCNYWSLDRNNGSSNVYVTLPWDTGSCWVYDTTYLHIAQFTSSNWADKGHGVFSGSYFNGKMTSNSPITTYGKFTFAQNTSAPTVCSTVLAILVGTGTSFTTSSSVLASSSLQSAGYVTGNSLTTFGFSSPVTILVNGTFTINSTNFTFLNCNVRMQANAEIVQNTSTNLTITNSHIYACSSAVWKRIYIPDNSALLTINGTGTGPLQGFSAIEDADTAVVSHSGGRFNINKVFFNKNWVSISVHEYASTHPGVITNGTRFTCYSTYSSGTMGTYMLSPYSGSRSSVGIFTIDNSSFTVQSQNSSKLLFENLANGIYSRKTNVNVYNNLFRNMIGNVSTVGIGVFFSGSPTGSTQNIGSATYPNTFTDCQIGVRGTQNINPKIKYNTFTNTSTTLPNMVYGIFLDAITQNMLLRPDIIIDHNTINGAASMAIYCRDAFHMDTYDITYNNINAGYSWGSTIEGGTGIYVSSGMPINIGYLKIDHNVITNMRWGVLAATVKPLNTDYSAGIISNNNIYIQATSPNTGAHGRVGILVYRGIRLHVYKNTVSRSAQATLPDKETGIMAYQCDNSQYTDNNLIKLTRGMWIWDQMIGIEFKCNSFDGDDISHGIDLGRVLPTGPVPATLRQQGSNTAPWDNEWDTGDDDLRIWETVINLLTVDWYYRSTSSSGNKWFLYNAVTPLAQVVPIQATSPGSVQCPLAAPSVRTFDREILASFILDTLRYDEEHLANRYQAMETVYDILVDDPDVMDFEVDRDTLFQDFYDLHQNTNIGYYREVEDLMAEGEIEEALEALEAITDTNLIEENKKIVYTILINTYLSDIEMSAEDSIDLAAVACQNSHVGGKAVWFARHKIEYENYEEEGCEEERYAANNSPVKSPQSGREVIVYPQPSGEVVNVLLKNPGNIHVIEISDLAGRVLKSIRVNGNIHQVLNVSDISSGIYLLAVKNKERIVYSQKITVNR